MILVGDYSGEVPELCVMLEKAARRSAHCKWITEVGYGPRESLSFNLAPLSLCPLVFSADHKIDDWLSKWANASAVIVIRAIAANRSITSRAIRPVLCLFRIHGFNLHSIIAPASLFFRIVRFFWIAVACPVAFNGFPVFPRSVDNRFA